MYTVTKYSEREVKTLCVTKETVSTIMCLEAPLFNATNSLYQELIDSENKQFELAELSLSEVFTLKNNISIFFIINPEEEHYEFTSLLRFWDELYNEMKQVVYINDTDTILMSSLFEKYSHQHEIVREMLEEKYNSFE